MYLGINFSWGSPLEPENAFTGNGFPLVLV